MRGQLSFPDVFAALTDIRQLIEQLHTRDAIVFVKCSDRVVVGAPDMEYTDWIVVADCGHLSPWFVEYAKAFSWTCGICDERGRQQTAARDLLHRLRHLASATGRVVARRRTRTA